MNIYFGDLYFYAGLQCFKVSWTLFGESNTNNLYYTLFLASSVDTVVHTTVLIPGVNPNILMPSQLMTLWWIDLSSSWKCHLLLNHVFWPMSKTGCPQAPVCALSALRFFFSTNLSHAICWSAFMPCLWWCYGSGVGRWMNNGIWWRSVWSCAHVQLDISK